MFVSQPNLGAGGRHASAFSLIELLMVIAIVSALLAVAVPNLAHAPSNELQASREIVKAQLRHARSHAISKRTPTALIAAPGKPGDAPGARSISTTEVSFENGTYLPIADGSGEAQLIQRFSSLPGSAALVASSAINSPKPTFLDQERTLRVNHRGNTLECHFIVFGANGQILHPPPGTPVHIAIATKRGARGSGGFELIHVNRLTGATRSVQP